MAELPNPVKDLPLVEIEYCRQCRWLLRAAWMAQELLSTFEDELAGVTLKPGTAAYLSLKFKGMWSGRGRPRGAFRTSPN